jgi:hypothetical protein
MITAIEESDGYSAGHGCISAPLLRMKLVIFFADVQLLIKRANRRRLLAMGRTAGQESDG